MSFAENMNNKYSQKRLDKAKSTTNALKKRAIQKSAEATGDLFGNKIADKVWQMLQRNLPRNYIRKKKKLIMKYQWIKSSIIIW